METLGTYSIDYCSKEAGHDSYTQFAVDWNWKQKGQWARSIIEGGGGTPWVDYRGLDEEAYCAILVHFELQDWAGEFPMEKIIYMSPGQLAKARREKEAQLNLSRKEMVGHAVGNQVPAESYA